MQVLSESDFRTVPWKNGAGVTTDMLMRPDGATHETFDIRIARAPITAEGPFSSFPGIDRTITLIRGQCLGLTFDDRTIDLTPLHPVSFDSVLAPHSRLPDGAVEVINVMTRRGAWSASVEMLKGAQRRAFALRPGAIGFVYALAGEARASDGAATVLVSAGQALIADCGLAALEAGPALTALLAVLTPAAGR